MLSIYGTLNDLAMCGARGRSLSVSFILEEGLCTSVLMRVVRSMGEAAESQGVQIVTGDTKVVERGKCDGLYITTSGVGDMCGTNEISPKHIEVGDKIILSGDIGRHGISILGERAGFHFQSKVESDVAALWPSVQKMLQSGIPVHCLRDLTRVGSRAGLLK